MNEDKPWIPEGKSPWFKVLYFLDLLNDDGPRLSATKLAFWGSTLLNILTLWVGADWKVTAGAGVVNLATLIKHEMSKSRGITR